jgi:hypothetical protein
MCQGQRSGRAFELLCDAGEVLPLVEGVLQLHFTWQPRAIGGEGAGAVGAATLDLVHAKELSAEGVPHRHKYHAVVGQLGNCRQSEESNKKRLVVWPAISFGYNVCSSHLLTVLSPAHHPGFRC